MPYSSNKQRKFFHTETAAREGITHDMVQKYDQASKGKKLPERAMKSNSHKHAHKAMEHHHVEARKITEKKDHPEFKKIPPLKAAHLLYEKHVNSKKKV